MLRLVRVLMLGVAISIIIGCSAEKEVNSSDVVASTQLGKPIEVKVVVVTMFEIGEDEGDAP
ncbi:hypothetical protein RS130_15135 [Paraglaciecola aquimarina]|uniref:Lipoprotein n=1 Tax=Paraglaciecola aquimarina TaxID=1235557 RepID=A0ABU3SYG6_9ALTE|nr:hypothetical protein [Paraglaciecola aquimarina]MDU0355054.1 hypothetical protein [Paraglaciecola aquimarina]